MTIQVKAQLEAARWVISAAMPAWVPEITNSKCNVSVIEGDKVHKRLMQETMQSDKLGR